MFDMAGRIGLLVHSLTAKIYQLLLFQVNKSIYKIKEVF
tara:strand:+ start:222 stop:338 length:117 start_codon:yes stop_codon:yes gene_type:complete